MTLIRPAIFTACFILITLSRSIIRTTADKTKHKKDCIIILLLNNVPAMSKRSFLLLRRCLKHLAYSACLLWGYNSSMISIILVCYEATSLLQRDLISSYRLDSFSAFYLALVDLSSGRLYHLVYACSCSACNFQPVLTCALEGGILSESQKLVSCVVNSYAESICK